jgi:hypothetical protein
MKGSSGPFPGDMAKGGSPNQHLCMIIYEVAPMNFVNLQLSKQSRATGQHVGLRNIVGACRGRGHGYALIQRPSLTVLDAPLVGLVSDRE